MIPSLSSFLFYFVFPLLYVFLSHYLRRRPSKPIVPNYFSLSLDGRDTSKMSIKNFIRTSTHLVSKSSPTPSVPVESLSGKLIFFYFSASWCPPCRAFTPQLAAFYKNYKDKKNFEVIFVSWDKNKEDFANYYEKMPWLALPFEDRAGGEFLMKGFSVESIPTLIGVDADTGKIVTTTARARLPQDPEGKDFPWAS